MSENWTKRTLTVDHPGKGIDQGAKGMTIADAHATIDRMKDETKNIERRLSRLDGRSGGSPDHVEPEYFVPVDRKTGAIGGDEAPRALERRAPEDPDEVLPEYLVMVDRKAGVIGGD